MSGRAQRGFSIVSAVFLLVVVALVAAFLVSVGSVSRTTSAFAAVETRAHYAAASGMEWAVHRVLANPAAPACFASPTTFTVGAAGGGGFAVTATCVETEVSEGADSYSVFDLDVAAESGTSGQENYFRRTLSASVATPPL